MQNEYEGINELRSGSLIIASSAFIGLIVLIIMVVSSVASLNDLSTSVTSAFSMLGTLAAVSILTIIEVVTNIVGLIYIKNGFEILQSLGRDVKIGYIGTILALIFLVIIIIGLFIGGGVIVLVAGVFGTIADVLVGAGFYKVGEIYKEGITKIAGILEVIGGIVNVITTPLLDFIFITIFLIAFILLYIGLGKIYLVGAPMSLTQSTYPINNANPVTTSAPPAQPNYPQQIYQVGQGIIRGNGYAQISLYSSSQATILSARIEGTTLSSVNVNPVVLQPGQNEITIWFNSTSSLISNANYFITLVIDIGGNISGIRTTAVYQP